MDLQERTKECLIKAEKNNIKLRDIPDSLYMTDEDFKHFLKYEYTLSGIQREILLRTLNEIEQIDAENSYYDICDDCEVKQYCHLVDGKLDKDCIYYDLDETPNYSKEYKKGLQNKIKNFHNRIMSNYLEVDYNLFELLYEQYDMDYISVKKYPMVSWFIKDNEVYFDFDEDGIYEEVVIAEKTVRLKEYTLILDGKSELIIFYNEDELSNRGMDTRYYYNLSRGKEYDSLNSIYCDKCWNIISRLEDENINKSVTKGEVACNECGYIVPNTDENFYIFNGLKYNDHVVKLTHPYPVY